MTKRVVRAGLPEELKTSVGNSSPCSPETNFRELDDVFLQNQTRIWLGEVLHIRFDEETSISDLLADGEFLFQVSKVVWKKLLKKNAELRYSKVYIYERTSSFGKKDGKYMAYPKVDSFLKICQILGFTGVDLFSPSDVVEKRDVRRVCMCIRTLSKRARLKGLNVPDFEIVTYTVVMPTDLVCGIKRTLEQSHSSSSNSTGSSSSLMELREIYRQRSSSGLHIQHYDSQSESDETESSLAEFEFQSPLSITSYDDANLYSIIGENSPEENWIIHGNISELQRQFRLDTREQNEVSHKGCVQIGNHDFMDGFRKKSYSSHTESQIDQDTRTCLDDMGEELWSLSNSRNHEDNIVDREYCPNFTSAYEDSSYELDEPLVVDPEDAFIPFHSMLWREGHHKQLPKFSFSGCDKKPDNGRELKATLDTLDQAQTISFRQGDNGMKSQNMVNYNHDVSINSEIKRENNDAITLQMVPSNLISEVPLLGNCISDHADIKDFICHGTDDGKDSEVSNKFLLSMETIDVDQEEAKNGLERKAVGKVGIDQMYSTPSLISEDKYNNSIASIRTLPHVNSLREEQLFDAILENPTDEHASAVVDRVEITKNGTDLFTTEKCGLCIESDGMSSHTNIGSYTHDIQNDPPLYMDCQSAGCSVSALVENKRVSQSSTDLPISDDIDSNQSRYPLLPSGRSTTGALVEKDGVSCCTHNLEMDAYEQPNKTIMSNTENTAVNILACGVRDMCRGIKSDGFDSELTIGKEEMITSGTREQDSSYHLCEINKELTVEPRENSTDGPFIGTSMHIQDSNVPQMEIPEPTCTIGREIRAEEGINVQYQGLAPLIDNCTSSEPEKLEDNGSMKNTGECEKELGAKLDSCGKHNERAKGNRVLRSIAGAMTLLGALFFVHHIRQKRDKEKSKETVRAQQDQNPYQEAPTQNRVEVAKSTMLYPGERFKF